MKSVCALLLCLDPVFGQINENSCPGNDYTMSGQPSYALPPENINSNFHAPVRVGGIYLNEKGRGDLFQITRYQEDLTLELPVMDGVSLLATRNIWQELTMFDGQTHGADGVTLTINAESGANIRGSASWTTKRYDETDFKNTESGYGRLSMKLYDRVIASVGFERTDEIYNYFSILQGMQSDNWLLNLYSDITPRLEVDGAARYIDYSDNNAGFYFRASAGYALTDYPRLLKISVSQEYRDTKENYLALYFQDYDHLANIIHPYWCPWNYSAQTLTLEWQHDISSNNAIGMEHAYGLKTSFSMDSENNPSVQIQANWHRVFWQHGITDLSVMIYRSGEWDAESAFVKVGYRF